MRIFVVGAGFTGMQLAKELIAEKNDVVLVENDAERVRHAVDIIAELDSALEAI